MSKELSLDKLSPFEASKRLKDLKDPEEATKLFIQLSPRFAAQVLQTPKFLSSIASYLLSSRKRLNFLVSVFDEMLSLDSEDSSYGVFIAQHNLEQLSQSAQSNILSKVNITLRESIKALLPPTKTKQKQVKSLDKHDEQHYNYDFLHQIASYSPAKAAQALIDLKDPKVAVFVFLRLDEEFVAVMLRNRLLLPKLIDVTLATPGGLEFLTEVFDTMFSSEFTVDGVILAYNNIMPLKSSPRRRILASIREENAAKLLLQVVPKQRKKILTSQSEYKANTSKICAALEELSSLTKENNFIATQPEFVDSLAILPPREAMQSLVDLYNPQRVAQLFSTLELPVAVKLLSYRYFLATFIRHLVELPRGLEFILQVISSIFSSKATAISSQSAKISLARENILSIPSEISRTILVRIRKKNAVLILMDLPYEQVELALDLGNREAPLDEVAAVQGVLEGVDKGILIKLSLMSAKKIAEFLGWYDNEEKTAYFFLQLHVDTAAEVLFHVVLLPKIIGYIDDLEFIIEILQQLMFLSKFKPHGVLQAQRNVIPLDKYVRRELLYKLKRGGAAVLLQGLTMKQVKEMLDVEETEYERENTQEILESIEGLDSTKSTTSFQLLNEVQALSSYPYRAAEKLTQLQDPKQAASVFIQLDEQFAAKLLRNFSLLPMLVEYLIKIPRGFHFLIYVISSMFLDKFGLDGIKVAQRNILSLSPSIQKQLLASLDPRYVARVLVDLEPAQVDQILDYSNFEEYFGRFEKIREELKKAKTGSATTVRSKPKELSAAKSQTYDASLALLSSIMEEYEKNIIVLDSTLFPEQTIEYYLEEVKEKIRDKQIQTAITLLLTLNPKLSAEILSRLNKSLSKEATKLFIALSVKYAAHMLFHRPLLPEIFAQLQQELFYPQGLLQVLNYLCTNVKGGFRGKDIRRAIGCNYVAVNLMGIADIEEFKESALLLFFKMAKDDQEKVFRSMLGRYPVASTVNFFYHPKLKKYHSQSSAFLDSLPSGATDSVNQYRMNNRRVAPLAVREEEKVRKHYYYDSSHSSSPTIQQEGLLALPDKMMTSATDSGISSKVSSLEDLSNQSPKVAAAVSPDEFLAAKGSSSGQNNVLNLLKSSSSQLDKNSRIRLNSRVFIVTFILLIILVLALVLFFMYKNKYLY